MFEELLVATAEVVSTRIAVAVVRKAVLRTFAMTSELPTTFLTFSR